MWWLTVSQNRQKKNLHWQVREKKRKEFKNNWLWAADLGEGGLMQWNKEVYKWIFVFWVPYSINIDYIGGLLLNAHYTMIVFL